MSADLRAAAEAVTGGWWDDADQVLATVDAEDLHRTDAEFIAAASPAAVVDLIAERDQFRSQAALFQTGLAKAEQALVEADSILSLIRHRYLFPGKHPADLFDDVDSTLRHIRQVAES